MIYEIAEIEVKPGEEAAFEAGVQKAAPLFERAKGCKGMELQRTIELQPDNWHAQIDLGQIVLAGGKSQDAKDRARAVLHTDDYGAGQLSDCAG